MASVQDIRDLVLSYVDGKISASDLANRFVPVLSAAMKSGDGSVRQLALAVHAQVSHHFNGLISEQEFRSNLEPIAELAEQVPATFSIQITKTIEVESTTFNPGFDSVKVSDFHFATS